jgi:hypothetical protein|uniref:Uncharacterized protein n=1 Tax=Populus trichocarpa TaxID=3694 RepID=A9P823_POPTR|nr:unknown [Populus trichocarpa]
MSKEVWLLVEEMLFWLLACLQQQGYQVKQLLTVKKDAMPLMPLLELVKRITICQR